MTTTETPSNAPAIVYDWTYIIGMIKHHRHALIVAQIIALLAVITSVPIPLLMPLLVDEVLLHRPGRMVDGINALFPATWHGPALYIGAVLLITLLLRLMTLGLGVWQTRNFTLIAKNITYQIRQTLLLRLQRIALSEYETLGSGVVTSHFVTDVNAIDEFIGVTVSKFVVAVLSLVGAAAILLWMQWQLALFILLLNPIVVYFTMTIGKRVKALKKRENSAIELFQQALIETLDAIQQIRAVNRERHYFSRVIDRARGIKTHAAAFSWKSDAASRLSFMVFLVGFDTFRAIAMLMVVFSNLTIGEMMAVFGYLWFMMSPMQEILNIQYAYYGAQAALGRINHLLALREEPRYPTLHNPFVGKATVGVLVEEVCFAYGDGPLVLNHVTLDIQPGEKVALVGASGGGKSTLVQVILGMYPARSGRLYFDGIPVTQIGLDIVREHVATVLQHPALFNDTVRMNLTLGRTFSDNALWRALEVAQLRETIEKMTGGLNTIIGHQGVRLSGGQRQCLAIARMALSNPSVVILDEATSALDAETEAHLHLALNTFLAGRTTLIIAHRLSAVKQADHAYVFDDGHIIEEGAHAELMQSDTLYRRLYGRLQH